MYESHFGLREAPFSLTPDTSFFFDGGDHSDALQTLIMALRMGEGFVKVTGEVGTGKTVVCRRLLHELEIDARYTAAYLPNPDLSPRELRLALADELGLERRRSVGPEQIMRQITERLLGLRAEGRRTVLIIDEAQALSTLALETVRLLTNLETQKSKLLQVVLFGQPELDHRLDRHETRQLKQRISFSQKIRPMSRRAVQDYLAHRLSVAGYQGPPLFDQRLAGAIHRASGGVPRLINVLAHKCLLSAWGEGVDRVNAQHLKRAIADTESVKRGRPGRLRRVLRRTLRPFGPGPAFDGDTAMGTGW